MDAPTGIAVCTLITQAGVIGTLLLNQRHADKERKKVADATDVVAKTLREDSSKKDRKLDAIHVLVNSRLTLALAAIAGLKRKLGIELLDEELKAEQDAEALRANEPDERGRN